jgi:hypothetical protein
VGYFCFGKELFVNHQIYHVMRKPSTGMQRSGWISPTTGNMYCGICLRGRVEMSLGSRCAICDSRVVRDFTATQGGVDRHAYAAIRAEKRKRETAHTVPVSRSGNVLTMRAG